MTDGTPAISPAVSLGLRRLQDETFRQGSLGFGSQEVVSTSVIHQAWSRRTEDVKRNGIWGYREFAVDFSHHSMDWWLKEVRRESYRTGAGTWTSCKVYLFPTPMADSKPSILNSLGRTATMEFLIVRRTH